MELQNLSTGVQGPTTELEDIFTIASREAMQNEIPNPLTTAAFRIGAKVGSHLCGVVFHESGTMFAISTLFSVPESKTNPENARFLTEEEKAMLEQGNLYIESYLEMIFVQQIIPKYPK